MMPWSGQSVFLSVGAGVLLTGVVLQWVKVRDVKEGDRSTAAQPVKLGGSHAPVLVRMEGAR